MTRDEFRGVTRLLVASWPAAAPLGQDALAAAWDVLGGLEAEAVLTAVRTFVRDGERFQPTAGQVYRRIVDIADDSPPWEWAWMELSRLARNHGRCARPAEIPWSHPLIAETATTIDWEQMFDTARDVAGQGFVRRIYEALREERHRRARYTGLAVPPRTLRLTAAAQPANGPVYTDPAEYGL